MEAGMVNEFSTGKPQMQRIARFAACLMALMLFAPAARSQPADAPPGFERVSLIRLMAEPEKYDGRRLQVAGFFVEEEEDYALYLSPDDAENGVSNGGIELNFHIGSKINPFTFDRYNRKYVSLIGIFHVRAPSQWAMRAATGWRGMVFTDIEQIHAPPYKKFDIPSGDRKE
jgi:hypothetical protein